MTWLGPDDYEFHSVSFSDGVLLVEFDRSEQLNVLTLEALDELAMLLHVIRSNPDIRSVVLTGSGRAFCAGGNAKAMGAKTEDKGAAHPLERPLWNTPSMSVDERLRLVRQTGREIMVGIHQLDKPFIAAVNGLAAGAGMDLALACDIRLASTEARFSQIYVRRGLPPADGGMYWLPRLIGWSNALELMLTGDWVEADRAESLGLVSRVVAPDQLIDEALDLARRIAENPPLTVQAIKYGARNSAMVDLPEALELSYRLAEYLFHTDDHREAIAAWVEKRDPSYEGK